MNTYFIRIRSQLNSGGLDGDLHVNSQPSSDLDSKIHDEKNSSTTGRNAYKKGDLQEVAPVYQNVGPQGALQSTANTYERLAKINKRN